MLWSLWHWYTTAASSCGICGRQDNALIAIASVSAVAWTGGLVAYQIKRYTVGRAFALDILQASFMGCVFGLFMTPLTLRYVATAFTLFYVYSSVYALLFQYKNIESVRKRLKGEAKTLPDDVVDKIRETGRRYAWLTLASMIAYVAIIVWPYPETLAGVAALLLFAGYQTVVWQLNTAPDKLTLESLLPSLLPRPTPPPPPIAELYRLPTKPNPVQPPKP